MVLRGGEEWPSMHRNKGQSTPLPSVIERAWVSTVQADGVCQTPCFAVSVLTPEVLPISFLPEGEVTLNLKARNGEGEM